MGESQYGAHRSGLVEAVQDLFVRSVGDLQAQDSRKEGETAELMELYYDMGNFLHRLVNPEDCTVVKRQYPEAVIRLVQSSAARALIVRGKPRPATVLQGMEELVREPGGKSGLLLKTLLDEIETADLWQYEYPESLPLIANLSGRDERIFRSYLRLFCQHFYSYCFQIRKQLKSATVGSRRLFRHPLIRVFLSDYLLVSPKESLELLEWLGLAASFNDPRLDTHLGRFVPSGDSEELPECVRPLVRADASCRKLMLEWSHFGRLVGEEPELSQSMEKLLHAADRMQEELEHLRQRYGIGAPDRIARRMANLEQYLNNGETLFQDNLQEVIDTVQGKVDELKFRALRQLVGDFFLEYLRRIAGEWAGDVQMTTDLVNVVQLYYSIRKNRRLLKALLIHHLRGEPEWVRELPANVEFLQALRRQGIDADRWTGPCEQTFRFLHGNRKQVRLYFETDPIRILQMGNYFDTCLSFDQMNAFSTVANAVDLNKRVVYAEDDGGNIVGRKLVALNERFELVGFYTYTSLEDRKANVALRRCFIRFLKDFAQRCRLSLNDKGEVPKLASEDWYDDGIWSWKVGRARDSRTDSS